MRPDETLDGLLRAFEAQNAKSLRLVETADLDAAVPVPQDIPWFPKNQEAWSVRWVILHVINELARHAGHADIIRETIDGATMYELIAGLEGWEIDGVGQALAVPGRKESVLHQAAVLRAARRRTAPSSSTTRISATRPARPRCSSWAWAPSSRCGPTAFARNS